MTTKQEKQTIEYLSLVKRESALTALLNVHSLISKDSSLSVSIKSDMHKIVSQAYTSIK